MFCTLSNYTFYYLIADITTANAEIMQLKAALELKEAEKMFANGNFVI